jgi:hypothetical protein
VLNVLQQLPASAAAAHLLLHALQRVELPVLVRCLTCSPAGQEIIQACSLSCCSCQLLLQLHPCCCMIYNFLSRCVSRKSMRYLPPPLQARRFLRHLRMLPSWVLLLQQHPCCCMIYNLLSWVFCLGALSDILCCAVSLAPLYTPLQARRSPRRLRTLPSWGLL